MILRRLLPTLGVGAVPIAGLAAFGWSAATALAVYWFENLVGSLTVALRIAVHRRLTKKRGSPPPRYVDCGNGTVSHEMRTPLARIRFGLAVAGSGADAGVQRQLGARLLGIGASLGVAVWVFSPWLTGIGALK